MVGHSTFSASTGAPVGAVGVMAAMSMGRARNTPKSSSRASAARVVAKASKVDSVCILGSAGAVGQERRGTKGYNM